MAEDGNGVDAEEKGEGETCWKERLLTEANWFQHVKANSAFEQVGMNLNERKGMVGKGQQPPRNTKKSRKSIDKWGNGSIPN